MLRLLFTRALALIVAGACPAATGLPAATVVHRVAPLVRAMITAEHRS